MEAEDGQRPLLPPEIHFRVDEGLSRTPQFLVKTTSRGDLLVKLFAEKDLHYHLGLRFKGTGKGAVSFFLIRTQEKPKKHETLLETMPVCTEDLTRWRAWLRDNVDRIAHLGESVRDATMIVTREQLGGIGEVYSRVVVPRRWLAALDSPARKLVIDDAFIRGAVEPSTEDPGAVLF
ncbi:MAG: hypothetical protein ACYS47_19945, partial [Planctomycetota bacterium]